MQNIGRPMPRCRSGYTTTSRIITAGTDVKHPIITDCYFNGRTTRIGGGIKMNDKLYRVAYKLEQRRRNELDKKIIEAILKGGKDGTNE